MVRDGTANVVTFQREKFVCPEGIQKVPGVPDLAGEDGRSLTHSVHGVGITSASSSQVEFGGNLLCEAILHFNITAVHHFDFVDELKNRMLRGFLRGQRHGLVVSEENVLFVIARNVEEKPEWMREDEITSDSVDLSSEPLDGLDSPPEADDILLQAESDDVTERSIKL